MALTLKVCAVVALVLLTGSCSHAPKHGGRAHALAAPRLVLVSIDGLRPAHYSDPDFQKWAPTLAALAGQGEKAPKGIQPIFPSITYPNHTAMVTGADSAESGIYNNKIFSATEGPTDEWYWYASALRVQAVWQAAEEAGLKVAMFRWPVTVGADVQWLIPEVFASGNAFDAIADWDVIRKNTDPAFMRHVLDEGAIKKPMSVADMDQIDTQATEWVLQEAEPDLILLHLIDLDHAQHQFGTDAWEVKHALQQIDSEVARIVKLLDPKKTTLIVTGDHGFANYTRYVNLKPIIRQAGLFEQVVDQADGGQSAIYAKPGGKALGPGQKDPCAVIARVAGEREKGLLKEISKKQLMRLHAYPDALCALETKMGTAFGSKTSASELESTDHMRGHHGWLPSHPEMRAGFFIWGKGLSHPGEPLEVGRGYEMTDLKMPDIAPTAAGILGIPFRALDGAAIRF